MGASRCVFRGFVIKSLQASFARVSAGVPQQGPFQGPQGFRGKGSADWGSRVLTA